MPTRARNGRYDRVLLERIWEKCTGNVDLCPIEKSNLSNAIREGCGSAPLVQGEPRPNLRSRNSAGVWFWPKLCKKSRLAAVSAYAGCFAERTFSLVPQQGEDFQPEQIHHRPA